MAGHAEEGEEGQERVDDCCPRDAFHGADPRADGEGMARQGG